MATAFSVSKSNKPDTACTATALSLVIPQPLEAPELSSPEDLTNFPSERIVTLSWVAVAGATEYEIEVSDDSTFLEFRTETFRTASTSQVTSRLEEDKSYYWRVRAVASKTSSEWSDVWQFSTRKDKDTAQDVWRPQIDELSVSDSIIDLSSTENDSTATITIELKENVSGEVTGVRWSCWTYSDGHGTKGERLDYDDLGIYGGLDPGAMSDENSQTFTAPKIEDFGDGVNYWTFFVKVRVWNEAGSDNKTTQIAVKVTTLPALTFIIPGLLVAEDCAAVLRLRRKMVLDKIDAFAKTSGSATITIKESDSFSTIKSGGGTTIKSFSATGENLNIEPTEHTIDGEHYVGVNVGSPSGGIADLTIIVSGI